MTSREGAAAKTSTVLDEASSSPAARCDIAKQAMATRRDLYKSRAAIPMSSANAPSWLVVGGKKVAHHAQERVEGEYENGTRHRTPLLNAPKRGKHLPSATTKHNFDLHVVVELAQEVLDVGRYPHTPKNPPDVVMEQAREGGADVEEGEA